MALLFAEIDQAGVHHQGHFRNGEIVELAAFLRQINKDFARIRLVDRALDITGMLELAQRPPRWSIR